MRPTSPAEPGSILIRPAVVMPLEVYSSERKAEFLLENAVGARDYTRAIAEVRRLGLDPGKIRHRRPKRKRKR